MRGQELGQRLDDHPELVPRRAGSGDARRNRLAGADDIRQLLIEGQQNGEFCEFDPHVMAVLVRQGIDAIGLEAAFDPEADLKAFAGELMAMFDRATRRES